MPEQDSKATAGPGDRQPSGGPVRLRTAGRAVRRYERMGLWNAAIRARLHTVEGSLRSIQLPPDDLLALSARCSLVRL